MSHTVNFIKSVLASFRIHIYFWYSFEKILNIKINILLFNFK